MEAVLAFMIWLIVGGIVVETCRIWRCWYLSLDFVTALFWPVILVLTIMKGDRE